MTDRVFALVLVVFVAGVMIAGQIRGDYSWAVVRMPVLVGGLAIVLLIWVAMHPKAVPDKGVELETAEGDPPSSVKVPALRRDLTGMVQVVLAIPVFWCLGFVAGPGAYILGILLYHRQGWKAAVLGGLAGALLSWGLFATALSVPIPLGPLFLDW